MRSYLLLMSILLFCCQLPCRSAEVAGDTIDSRVAADSTVCSEYMFLMQARGHELTGICITNETADGELTGAIVNEFGVKAFDFVIKDGKAKVMNVMGPLDKWYIRKVLRGDIGFAFQHIRQGQDFTLKKRTISFDAKGDIHVENKKYKIHYTFTPIVANDETDQ